MTTPPGSFSNIHHGRKQADWQLRRIGRLLEDLNEKDPYYLGETQTQFISNRSVPVVEKKYMTALKAPIEEVGPSLFHHLSV